MPVHWMKQGPKDFQQGLFNMSIIRKENALIEIIGLGSKKGLVRKQGRIRNGMHSTDRFTGEMLPTLKGIIAEKNGTSPMAAERCRGSFNFGDTEGYNGANHLCEIRYPNKRGIKVKFKGQGKALSSINGNKAIFADGGDSSFHIESSVLYNGIRNEIVINDSINAPDEYIFYLKPDGYYTFHEQNNGILCKSAIDGENVFISPPTAIDENGEPGDISLNLLQETNGLIPIVKTVDTSWMRESNRGIILDPTVTIENGVDGGIITDTYIQSNFATNNFTATPYVLLFSLSALANGLWFVDLSAYSGTVNELRFDFENILHIAASPNTEFYQVERTWIHDQATYNNATTVQAWGAPGCNAASDRSLTLFDTKNISGLGPFSVDATVPGQVWFNDPADNKGMFGKTDGAFRIGSTENVTPAYNPSVFVDWEEDGAVGNINRKLGRGLTRGIGRGL